MSDAHPTPPAIAPSRRVRRTPFSTGVEAAGVSRYSVYNHMLLPAAFAGMEEDYHHLKRHVQLWDVACERQVAIRGPDAQQLITLLSPRDLEGLADDQCLYVPVVNAAGRMLNDPVLLKPGGDEYWLSIADSDLLFYVSGVADAAGLDVEVFEPDVSPLGVQGPKADELMIRVFGKAAGQIDFFRFRRLEFRGTPMIVARSGYSGQGGFEIYLPDTALGMELWGVLMAAGVDLNIRVGCPNTIERIEYGLLSYGNDMTLENTPFEAGLGRYVTSKADYLAASALRSPAIANPARIIRPVAIAGHAPPCDRSWQVQAGGRFAGRVTSAAWSPDFGETVAIAMIETEFASPGTRLRVQSQEGEFDAEVRGKFWAR